jgi:pimeloyl-ACP methyl ester carboxylesterase
LNGYDTFAKPLQLDAIAPEAYPVGVPQSGLPSTRFAQSGDVSIAYQVIGDGAVDIVVIPGIINNVELFHDIPGYSDFFRRLARFSRVVVFDKRGQGLSDRVSGPITLEQRTDDVRAVMRDVGMTKAAIIGISEAAALAGYFAATFPDQVSHLIIMHGLAKFARSEDYPWGATEENKEQILGVYGTGRFLRFLGPSIFGDTDAMEVALIASANPAVREILERCSNPI